MFAIQVPTFHGHEDLSFEPGRVTFVMGANGTGKSSLMDLISRQHLDQIQRIYAHRNVTFESSSISVSGEQRDHYDEAMRSIYSHPETRFRNQYASQTVNAHLYDLYVTNSAFTQKKLELLGLPNLKTTEGQEEHARIMAKPTPFQRLQIILNGAGLRLSLYVNDRGKMLAEQEGTEPYGIQELSDGERSAFLLSAAVITAKPNSLILIDEPERHMHRSISSSLISSLLQDRPDCTFVISTHDVSLSLDHQPSHCVLLRRFQHPGMWQFDRVNDAESLDERIVEAVLGARRTVLFVEGTRTSLDHDLYERLYPNVSVRACNGCREVIQATRGLNSVAPDHWVRAIGVIDRDRRSPEEITKLLEEEVVCLPVHDVEAIYYHPTVIDLIIQRLSEAGTIDPSIVLPRVSPTMVAEFEKKKMFLIKEAVLRELWPRVLSRFPTIHDLENDTFESESLQREELHSVLREEIEKFNSHVRNGEASELCAAYPLKKTGVRREISKLLGLKSYHFYENTVRKMVTSDEDAAEEIRYMLEPLTEKLREPG